MPSRNQKVERVIMLVSVTETKAIIQIDREGIVHSVLVSREELPKFKNKSFQNEVKIWSSTTQSKK